MPKVGSMTLMSQNYKIAKMYFIIKDIETLAGRHTSVNTSRGGVKWILS